MRINYIIIFVSNMSRSINFYRDLLGIPLKFESPEWTEFLTKGATLALHKSNASQISEVEKTGSAGQCRPGFQVPNLDEFHNHMIENKVGCHQEPTETFGARVAQYIDPDGLVFSIGELQGGE